MVITVVLAASIVLQVMAAIFALRLVRISGARLAWTAIAAGIALMAVRLLISFCRLISGDLTHPPDLQVEVFGLATSVLMVMGMAWLPHLFGAIPSWEEVLRKSEGPLAEARTFAENIIATVREPLLVLDAELRVVKSNRSFSRQFEATPEETEGRLLYDLGNRQWDIPALHRLLETILPQNTVFDDYEVTHDFEHIGRRTMVLNARCIYREANKPQMVLLAIEDITERKRAEKEIQHLNENRKHNIIQLEATNKELEAFAYSVSHDLRAPLRSMDGFSQALLEDYTEQLDERGQDYLRRVRGASQRMAQLIDDLLKLSRVTRAEMKRESVDLSALAEETVAALQKQEPARQVERVIQQGLLTQGDRNLLHVLLENLLGNAYKFTGKHPQARIEFGITGEEGSKTYFVRDDGVGFDPAYADKLFVAFQRLHSTADYPGTGIGLATVQRIIHRHGGRLWAEGAVEKGATFYFTL